MVFAATEAYTKSGGAGENLLNTSHKRDCLNCLNV